MSQTTATLDWTVPVEVRTFAQEQGVAACLPAILEATDRIFPGARRRALSLAEDPEITDQCCLIIKVDVALEQDEALACRGRWNEAVRQCCPSRLICTFCLSMDLVE